MKKISNSSNNSQTKAFLKSSLYSIIVGIILTVPSPTIAGDNGFVSNARLPINAQKSCETSIASWFVSNHASEDGWVKPANSLAPIFADSKNNTRCDFYKWGAQMFLWLTSGVGSQHVFNSSPQFYNLSVESNHEREFLTANGPMLMTVRKGKTDEEIELGQAGNSDALLSQKQALVYYGLHANDVYALFTTQTLNICQQTYNQCTSKIVGECNKEYKSCKTKALANIEFPNTQAQLDKVSTFAASYGYPLSWDKIALAMELKTSWVDADTVSDKNNYILSQAVVPVFDRSAKNGPWSVKSNQEKTLALVGMHIVGTVKGHPEMVWSTFEHVDNVPDNTYIYNVNANSPQTQIFNSSGKAWNFLSEGAIKPTSITANAQVNTDKNGSLAQEIVSINSSPISSTEVIRIDPWGNMHGSKAGSTAVANNTDLVSINVSVLSQLAADDVRGNYIQTGGIWTVDGQIPTGGTDTSLRGSLNLANTTMETYFQYQTKDFNPQNCFGCHGVSRKSNNTINSTGVSHVFDKLQPLPKK